MVTGQGIDANGRAYLIVSNWGKQYWIYLDEHGAGSVWDLDHDGMPDTDTDGDGLPDYTDSNGKTVNYDPNAIIYGVIYD